VFDPFLIIYVLFDTCCKLCMAIIMDKLIRLLIGIHSCLTSDIEQGYKKYNTISRYERIVCRRFLVVRRTRIIYSRIYNRYIIFRIHNNMPTLVLNLWAFVRDKTDSIISVGRVSCFNTSSQSNHRTSMYHEPVFTFFHHILYYVYDYTQ